MSKAQAYDRAVELMERVGIPRAADRLRSYPHEFSGGMRQRVMIAMALSCSPKLLIADEPTTALDVTIQAQILDELRELRDETGAGVILVTHDLGVVADIADRVIVMYSGRVVEQGTLDDIFYDPQHPYTWGLLGSITRIDADRSLRLPAIPGMPPSLLRPPKGCHFRPRCPHAFKAAPRSRSSRITSRIGPRASIAASSRSDQKRRLRAGRRPDRVGGRRAGDLMTDETEATDETAAPARRPRASRSTAPLLAVDHLRVLFPIKSGVIIDRKVGQVHAVDDVSFRLDEGETLGIVGESGCGKTTLIRVLVRLIEATSGTINFRGQDITNWGRGQLEPVRREMQMVFQDPQASLNPRKRVAQILATPLRMRGVQKSKMVDETRVLLDRVGLSGEHINRFPHEFSGGQRQRIGIARALAVDPRLILLDEPVSALDVSIQAQVINLLDDLQEEFHLSFIFVAHDLSVVRHVSDRIAVMYLGKLMELSPAEELYNKPIHPYTTALLSAIPIPDPKENRARTRNVVSGEPPNPIRPPSGCRFHTRCPRASDICRTSEPPLTEYADGHLAACHHPQSVTAEEISRATRSDTSSLSAGSEQPDLWRSNGDASASQAPSTSS